MTDPANYSGSIQTFAGGTPFGAPIPNFKQGPDVGKLTLQFTSPTTGTMTWPGGTLNLQRFYIDTTPVDYTKPGTFESGWYYVPGEIGRGLFIEQQGSSLFSAFFSYDDTGAATWQIVLGNTVGTGQWSGNFQRVVGGTTPTSGYRKTQNDTNFGTAMVYTNFSASDNYRAFFNAAAPSGSAVGYYTANTLSVQLPTVAAPQLFSRFRF